MAAEIRKPGTVTARVLRIVDEIDPKTAEFFERFCESRLGDVIPVCLSGELSFSEATTLVVAGLLVDPGFVGQVRQVLDIQDDRGRQLWFWGFNKHGLAIPKGSDISGANPEKGKPPLTSEASKAAVPVYVLTDAGHAVSMILPDKEQAAFDRFIGAVRSFAKKAPIVAYRLSSQGMWSPYLELAPDNSS